jgi:hypothetical protein
MACCETADSRISRRLENRFALSISPGSADRFRTPSFAENAQQHTIAPYGQ